MTNVMVYFKDTTRVAESDEVISLCGVRQIFVSPMQWLGGSSPEQWTGPFASVCLRFATIYRNCDIISNLMTHELIQLLCAIAELQNRIHFVQINDILLKYLSNSKRTFYSFLMCCSHPYRWNDRFSV